MSPVARRVGAIAIVVLAVAGSVAVIVASGAEQCPDDFTQEQIDASDCIVGANIGLGLAWLIVMPTLVLGGAFLAWRIWPSAESAPEDPVNPGAPR